MENLNLRHFALVVFCAALSYGGCIQALAATYPEEILKSGPIAYWRFGETGGKDLLDSTGNEIKSVLPEKSTRVDGPRLNGIDSNPSISFIDQPFRTTIKSLGTTYSVEMWFWNDFPSHDRLVTGYMFSHALRSDEEANGDHLGIGGSVNCTGCLIFFNGDKYKKLLCGTTKIKISTWNHIIMTREGEKITVYLNGNFKPEIAGRAEVTFADELTQIFVGGRSDGRFNFQGRIDELAIYNRVLTLDEVSRHYSASGQKPPAPELGLFGGIIPKDFEVPVYRPIPAQTEPVTQKKLDGIWRANKKAPADIQVTQIYDEGWSDFQIPGSWEPQGFELSNTDVAALGTDFRLPASFKGKRIFIRFDAVVGGTEYWLNGKKLGSSSHYWTPVEFDITDSVQWEHLNKLRLKQTRDIFSERLQFVQYWNLTPHWPHSMGVVRSVRIFALPSLHIRSLNVNTNLDESYRDAQLALDVEVDNTQEKNCRNVSLRIELVDPLGNQINLPSRSVPLDSVRPGITKLKIANLISNPLKWSAEKPWLYKLQLDLCLDGQVLESIGRNVGFRSVETKGHQVLINGTPIKFAGSTRHETAPVTNQADTGRLALQDVLNFKSINVTFVRTSHYPPTKEFLDAADLYGLYVEVECPFMWTFGKGENDPAHVREFLTPTAATVTYNYNHPSVITWSLGNESGKRHYENENYLPSNYQATHKLVKKLDSSRLTIFHNERNQDGGIPDMGNFHYPAFPFGERGVIKAILDKETRPVWCGEIFYIQGYMNIGRGQLVQHDPGTRVAWACGIEDTPFWGGGLMPNKVDKGFNYLYESKHLVGMNFWEGIGVGGLFDIWRRLKPEGWIAKRMYSPVHIPVNQVDFKPGQQSIQIPIENRYAFTNLGELTITWEIADSGTINTEVPLYGTGKKVYIDLPPRSKAEFEIALPQNARQGQLIIIRSIDSAGRLVDAHSVKLGQAKSVVPEPVSGCPTYTNQPKHLTVKGNNFGFVLDKSTGQISSVSNEKPVELLFFPSVYIVAGPFNSTLTKLPNIKSHIIDNVTVQQQDLALAIKVSDQYENLKGTTEMLLDSEGTCRISFDYLYSGKKITVRELGLRFLLNSDCQKLQWHRRADWGVYPDNQIGRPTGVAWAHRTSGWSNGGSTEWNAYSAWDLFAKDQAKITSPPSWPWSLDDCQEGTNDFRSTKFHFYWANLISAEGRGIEAFSNGIDNVRVRCAKDSILFHLWQQGQHQEVEKNSQIIGEFHVRLLQDCGQ